VAGAVLVILAMAYLGAVVLVVDTDLVQTHKQSQLAVLHLQAAKVLQAVAVVVNILVVAVVEPVKQVMQDTKITIIIRGTKLVLTVMVVLVGQYLLLAHQLPMQAEAVVLTAVQVEQVVAETLVQMQHKLMEVMELQIWEAAEGLVTLLEAQAVQV